MSPIFYVNAAPHIGHLYTSIYCDSIARFQRLKVGENDQVFFSIGTDEHGMKIQKKAKDLGYDSPLKMCDSNAAVFENLFSASNANIQYDRFVRTTDKSHKAAVAHIWETLKENGYIVKGEHQGFYSTNEETFFM